MCMTPHSDPDLYKIGYVTASYMGTLLKPFHGSKPNGIDLSQILSRLVKYNIYSLLLPALLPVYF